VVGYIPRLSPQEETLRQIEAGTAQLDPLLFSYYQTKSMESEAYRGVRTALYFSTQGEGHKVIQVTSPNPGDGKSTLAANLAVSIAQSGKRTLLIDGDLRKPRVHKVFGIPAEVGLASVIVGEAEPGDAVQESAVPNLFLLPSGPIPPNPAELLTSQRFKELLALLREQYDFVIVDTPPLLAVTDPSVVAAQVDGVLLTIRRTKNDRPPAERARSILSTLGVNVIGVVINGADKRNDSGGYGYGYGYGYGKSHYYEEAPTSTSEAAEGPK
jgi:capsular exopolysaccharide synthesis family protein